MKKQISIIMAVAAILCSCHNRTKEAIDSMSEYQTADSVLYCKVPSFLHLTRTEEHSLQFEGDKKIAKVMIVPYVNRWVKDDFAQKMIGDFRSKMTLVEENDSITAYEIQRGMTVIPAQMVSVYKRNGYAVILTTMGISLEIHKAMGQSIRCKAKEDKKETSSYQGKYISLNYPSTWNVNEHPNTQTADIYIGQGDHGFGVWLFRFEKEDDITFKEAMNSIAENWREVAKVNMSNEQINDTEWCKHDILMSVRGQEGRQISYYTLKGDYIYNVKFGNSATEVENNLPMIDSIMATVVIK
ncbi:MAG: hypothetical protein SPL77_06025 [Prevotella sp.]|nr:hypothetical protein [Prevotella sp.]